MLQRLLLIVLTAVLLLPASVQADQVDDDLQTSWEVLWDQRGSPRPLIRWLKSPMPIRYRIFGTDFERHKNQIHQALQAAAQASGLVFQDVSSHADAQTAQLDLEVVGDKALEDNLPCYTQPLKWSGGYFDKVLVRMRNKDTWRCVFHEMMHAMGVVGHPSGKTVLSYFPYRRDQLLPLDKTMLQAVYAQDMPRNATPLQAIQILSRYIVQQESLGLSPDEAQQRREKFLQTILASMEKFAQGDGEVPVIVRRSGRASEANITDAKREMAFYLGVAYLLGSIAPRDEITATQWFTRSALADYPPGQVMAGRAYYYGRGTTEDKTQGLRWLIKASAAGSAQARDELVQIEKALPAEDWTKLREAATP